MPKGNVIKEMRKFGIGLVIRVRKFSKFEQKANAKGTKT